MSTALRRWVTPLFYTFFLSFGAATGAALFALSLDGGSPLWLGLSFAAALLGGAGGVGIFQRRLASVTA